MSEPIHGPTVTVTPTTRGKQIRKAFASGLVSAGMAVTALQSALPYLHEAKWLPVWIAPLVAAFGAGWQSWKQAQDGQKLEPVNLSGTVPTPAEASTLTAQGFQRDLRQEIPAELPPGLGHAQVVVEQAEEFDAAQNRNEGE